MPETMKLKIEMKVDDLHGAEPHDAYMCPIGQTLQRMNWEPQVEVDRIMVHKSEDYGKAQENIIFHNEENEECECKECTGYGPETRVWICKNVPEEVKNFIQRYDDGKFVTPKTFELEFEEDYVELIDNYDFER